MIRGNKILCGNIGDSRATAAKKTEAGWVCETLSRDHKPDSPDERERILRANGRVEPYYDEDGNDFGPARVWLMDQNVPGLAMSRSIGDVVASWVGVSYEPEFQFITIAEDYKFLILASDGI